MRIAVVGAGAVGGALGGQLARGGADVTLVARGAHLDAIRERGLTVRTRSAEPYTVPVAATDDPAAVGPVGIVLFCVKLYDLDAAAALSRPLVGPGTVVLPAQNGVDHVARLGRVFGPDAVLGALLGAAARVDGPGTVFALGPPRVAFGEWGGGASPRTEALLPVFERAGIAAQLDPDIRRAVWEKFVLASASLGVPALTRLPVGPVMACPETRALCRAVMAETVAVARAHGVPLGDDLVDRHLALLARLPPGARPSMLQDVLAGRRLEVAYLHGALVRLARERGLDAPVAATIAAALQPYAGGAPDVPPEP